MVLIQEGNRVFGEIKYQKNIFNDYKPHFHNHLYLGAIKSGTIKVEFGKTIKIVTAKDIIIFNTFEVHKTTNIDAKDYYTLCLKQDWLEQNITSNFNLICNTLQNPKLYKIITNPSQISNNINTLKDELKSLLKYQQVKNSNIKSVAKATKEYILQNINKNISLSTIERNLGYDKSYIIREFKKAYSITPKQFIIILKTNLAKEQIKEANISHLAIDFGFFDQSHFNKNFKKIFAFPPKKFK